MGVNEQEQGRKDRLNIARRQMISRTARVFSKLGRSLFKNLAPIMQSWISEIMLESSSIAASGSTMNIPPIPDAFGMAAKQVMFEALAQANWLEFVYWQERSAAVHGKSYRGLVTLADDGEDLRKLLRGFIDYGTDSDGWKKVLPADAIRWIEGYSPNLKNVLEKDVLSKVNKVIQNSMIEGKTLQERMKALKEADPLIRTFSRHRIEAIAQTEITRADSIGRLIQMKSNELIEGVEYSIIFDDRTTVHICLPRSGLIMRLDDPRLPFNTPPLHVFCRSILLSVSRFEKPEGIHSDARWDEIMGKHPSRQRPGDVEVVREVLNVPAIVPPVAPVVPVPVALPLKSVINMGELSDKLSQKTIDEVRALIENAPEDIQKAWNKYVKDVKILDNQYVGTAHYSPGRKGIRYNETADLSNKTLRGNDRIPHSTILHETGHNIDHLLSGDKGSIGDWFKSEMHKKGNKRGYSLTDMLKKETESYVQVVIERERAKIPESNVIERLFIREDRAHYEIVRELCKKSSVAVPDISDIFEGASNAKIRGPWGHFNGDQQYWLKHTVGSEAFAEMFSASINSPESLAEIKRYFPKSYEIFLEIIQKMGGV